MGPACFVDNETTGLDRDLRQVWESALILPDGTEHVWQLPVDLGKADPKSLAMNGFHERRAPASNLTALRTFAAEFARLTYGLHLAGANVYFDEGDLWSILRANGECPMWHYHLIDVEALAAGCLARQRDALGSEAGGFDPRPPWKHTDLVRAMGLNPDDYDRHSALGDARMAKAVYEAVMGP